MSPPSFLTGGRRPTRSGALLPCSDVPGSSRPTEGSLTLDQKKRYQRIIYNLNAADAAYHALREDGVIGPIFRTAIRRFQQQYNLENAVDAETFAPRRLDEDGNLGPCTQLALENYSRFDSPAIPNSPAPSTGGGSTPGTGGGGSTPGTGGGTPNTPIVHGQQPGVTYDPPHPQVEQGTSTLTKVLVVGGVLGAVALAYYATKPKDDEDERRGARQTRRQLGA